MRTVDLEAAGRVVGSFPNIVSAWVFGSSKDGQAREGSDLDIGLLFAGKPTLGELASLRADLQTALEFDEIDLSPLNEASSILRFEAICGRLLFCRDTGRRAEFASLTAREYEHDMAMIEWSMAMRKKK
jgi:uncharacterized protein